MSLQPPADPQRASALEGDIRFDQYKLALEMITKMSDRRHVTNRFFIGLLSGFGGLYSVLAKARPSPTRSAWEHVLPIVPVGLCVAWWLLITSYRHVTEAKWSVIYKMEAKLPEQPFTEEDAILEKEERRFSITKDERWVPIIIGFVFLLLFIVPLL